MNTAEREMKSNPNLKRSGIKEPDKPSFPLKWKEKLYLYKWIRTREPGYLQKYQNVPELILHAYEKHLADTSTSFDLPFTSGERLYCIKERLFWYLHLKHKFVKILKISGLTAAEFALLFGYCSASSFHNASGKPKLIRGLVALVENLDFGLHPFRKR